jgi:S1-C subfamily serine protease
MVALLSLLGLFSILKLYQMHVQLEQQVAFIDAERDPLWGKQEKLEMVKVIEPWAEVQSRAKDTVVQIFSQIAEVDILQPYKTPNQGQSFGSGFIINDKGEIVTNAHVVANAKSVWIQVPSLGRRIIDVDVVGVCPERDLALLRIQKEGCDLIRKVLGKVPYLFLGDSDKVFRSDEILAIGYPLAQHSLKSTTGVVSGRENVNGQHYIQMSAPINPGSSGGPSLNRHGEVVGVNSATVSGAQNANYIIPINELKIILEDLHRVPLLRRPFLGIIPVSGSEALTAYLGNPLPGGVYVVETFKKSLLEKAGVRTGDMIYEINGHQVDSYGEMCVPWSEDKITIADYVSRLKLDQEVNIILYRKGERKKISVKFGFAEQLPVRTIYPDYEAIDYEIIAGMVITPLTLNHVALIAPRMPSLLRYTETKDQLEPALLLAHLFPDSQAHRSRALGIGYLVTEVNGKPVKTLQDLRRVVRASKNAEFLTFKTENNVFVAFPMKKVLREERRFSQNYHYPLSPLMTELLKTVEEPKKPNIEPKK